MRRTPASALSSGVLLGEFFIESAPLAEAYSAYIDHLIQKYRG
jgi:hypothetical protein